jgi:hypothetical protein
VSLHNQLVIAAAGSNNLHGGASRSDAGAQRLLHFFSIFPLSPLFAQPFLGYFFIRRSVLFERPLVRNQVMLIDPHRFVLGERLVAPRVEMILVGNGLQQVLRIEIITQIPHV